MNPLDTQVELYLAPEATGVHDWVPVTPHRPGDIVIRRGVDNLSSRPGPGRMAFQVVDPDGELNPQNPMSPYFGSIGLGTQVRAAIHRVSDQFGRTETNSWGAVGNAGGDTWTNGTSTGGTVSATDWTVSGGTARHSLPVDGAYRVSELSKTTRPFIDAEVLLTIKVPTSNVTGTGALATEVWFRATDVTNFVAVSLLFEVDETLRIAFYDRTNNVNRYLLYYTTIPGLSLSTATDYHLRCQLEGATMRAKLWDITDPEPLDWSVIVSGADVREGYIAVASYAFSGNTNTKPLVFQYDQCQVRIPVFVGDVTQLKPSGDNKSAARVTQIEVQDILNRIQTESTIPQSVMRRGRATRKRWFFIESKTASSGTTRTFTIPTSSVGSVLVGDFFFLSTTVMRKEDTQFRITGSAPSGANTVFTFTPDARDAVAAGDFIAVYREAANVDMPIAYWPMEDGDRSTQVASGLVGGQPMGVVGTVDFASESGFPCSGPILKINGAELNASIANYDNTNQAFTISFLVSMPSSDDAASGTDLIRFFTDGTGYSWEIRYTASGGGSLQLTAVTASYAVLFDSGQIDFSMRGAKAQITLNLQQVGGTVTYSLFKTNLDGSAGGVGPATVTGVTTLGKIVRVMVNAFGGYENVAFGHLTVVPGTWAYTTTAIDVVSWTNQNALHRYLRLCYEEDIPFSYHAHWDLVTTNLGPQKYAKLFDLLTQAPESDGGFLYAPRGAASVEYRTRGSLANQVALATFEGGPDGHIGDPFDPIVDYAGTRNYVTVQRIDGISAVAERDTGKLSTAVPPEGIGRREEGFTISLGSDSQAQNHANWRLGTGTVDKPRVSHVSARPAARNSISIERMAAITIGSRIDLAELSTYGVYGTLPQLVTGYTLRLGDRFDPELTMNCVPYEPYRALALTANDLARLDGYDTVTGSTLTTTQTGSLTLTSQSGQYLWTTDASDFPLSIMISGEEITLSAITGATSPQTATISARSVNGVVKSHAAGCAVNLARPNYLHFR